MAITRFDGVNYRFLSNFYLCPVEYFMPETGGALRYPSSENAYQAAKCPSRAREFLDISPAAAKRLGQAVALREDWDDVKDSVMHDVVLAKFSQNSDLRLALLATGNEELVEGNTWGDTYWGQVDGIGKNMLGKTLMCVRKKIRDTLSGTDDVEKALADLVAQEERRALIKRCAGPAPSVPVPLVRVVDENDREICRGYYFRWIKRQLCVAGDSLQDEDVQECVVYSGFADWNMPREIKVMPVDQPYRIELLDVEWYMA